MAYHGRWNKLHQIAKNNEITKEMICVFQFTFLSENSIKMNTIVLKEETVSLANVELTDFFKYSTLFGMFNMAQRSGRKPYVR